VHLLRLALPTDPPPPLVAVRPTPPRLPPAEPATTPDVTGLAPPSNEPVEDSVEAIRLCDADIQETARFVREFAVQHLIPWMEKTVVEWNENVRVRCTHEDTWLTATVCVNAPASVAVVLVHKTAFRRGVRRLVDADTCSADARTLLHTHAGVLAELRL
jgi:hypothetical protein